MKLNKNFLIHNTKNETVIVPTGKADFSGIVRGNSTLGVILELLQKDITEEEIIKALEKEYDAPKEVIRDDVIETLDRLRKIGAIDD